MRFAPLVSIVLLPIAAAAQEIAPTLKSEKEIARIEAQASASRTARGLFAATRGVPRREVRGSGLPDAIGVRGGAKPELVFDSLRMPALTETEAELLLVL